MKIKSLMYVLMGTFTIVACTNSDNENGEGTVDSGEKTATTVVALYSDEACDAQSLLASNLLVKEGTSLNVDVNIPIHAKNVYMKYSSASGEVIKALPYNSLGNRTINAGFDMSTTHTVSVAIPLPEDAVKPTSEEDAGFRFYHNTGVVMFEDDWPKTVNGYDNDFNDVVTEYDLKVTECQNEDLLPAQGYKEGLLLTLDVRAKGGRYPTNVGVELIGLNTEFISEIASRIVLKAGQGMMDELKTGTNRVVVEKELGGIKYTLTVDAVTGNPVIILDGLTELSNPNDQDKFFQVNENLEIGRPMLRAEIKLTGKNRSELSAEEGKAQLEAYRNLILDTKRQNFFIVAKNGTDREIHMKGYEPTRFYTGYDADSKINGVEMMKGVKYCSEDGFVWGIKVPVGVKHTYESESFMKAYEKFEGWIKSSGEQNQDWYLFPTPKKVVEAW